MVQTVLAAAEVWLVFSCALSLMCLFSVNSCGYSYEIFFGFLTVLSGCEELTEWIFTSLHSTVFSCGFREFLKLFYSSYSNLDVMTMQVCACVLFVVLHVCARTVDTDSL